METNCFEWNPYPRLSVGTSKGLVVINVHTNTVVGGEKTFPGELCADEIYFYVFSLFQKMFQQVDNVWQTFYITYTC